MVGHLIAHNILCLFEATLQPLCSADRDSGIFCTAAKALFIAVKGLSTAAQICDCCSAALLQLFRSTSWSHSAVLQQRCSFRTGIVILEVLEQNEKKRLLPVIIPWKPGDYNFISWVQWLAKININYYTVKEQKMERKSFKILKISLVSYSAERKWNHRVTKICF